MRRCSWQGPHLGMTGESRGFSQGAAGFSSYDGEFRLPLVMAQGSPIFHSSCQGERGIALELQKGKETSSRLVSTNSVFLSSGDNDLWVAFKVHPGSQFSSRVQTKNSALLSSCFRSRLEPIEWTKGNQASSGILREDSGLLSRLCRKRRASSRDDRGISWFFFELRRNVWGFA